jgi:hypothetical protein
LRQHAGSVVDIGVGGGRFVATSDARGFDINLATDWLNSLNRWTDPYSSVMEAATFWDSIEHIPTAAILKNVRRFVCSLPILGLRTHSVRGILEEEHCWYFAAGFEVRELSGFRLIDYSLMEQACGREDIESFAFERDRMTLNICALTCASGRHSSTYSVALSRLQHSRIPDHAQDLSPSAVDTFTNETVTEQSPAVVRRVTGSNIGIPGAVNGRSNMSAAFASQALSCRNGVPSDALNEGGQCRSRFDRIHRRGRHRTDNGSARVRTEYGPLAGARAARLWVDAWPLRGTRSHR